MRMPAVPHLSLFLHVVHTYRFGYVEFASAKPAKKAEQELNGAELSGREIRVDFATPRGDGGRGGGTPRGRGKWVQSRG